MWMSGLQIMVCIFSCPLTMHVFSWQKEWCCFITKVKSYSICIIVAWIFYKYNDCLALHIMCLFVFFFFFMLLEITCNVLFAFLLWYFLSFKSWFCFCTGVFDPMNQGHKGPAPPLESKPEDRWPCFGFYMLCVCVCVCVCVYVYASACTCFSVSGCGCVFVLVSVNSQMNACTCILECLHARERESAHVCMREREREREIACANVKWQMKNQSVQLALLFMMLRKIA